jgi:3-oxoacyl-[acyl-carrier protein] reductase
LEVDEASWDFDLNLNLKSYFLCCRAVIPVMTRQGGGCIVNVSSVNALRAVGEVGYSAAKAGVISLTQNIAVRHGEHGIRCNAICPGTIESETVSGYWDRKAGGREKLYDWYPLHRLGQPVEVANVALFLACDESSFVTGTVITVDGGLTAGWRYFGRKISIDF